ncbi:hypothetical protein AX17_004459 [Amanita inopinata Kibby_2008]|nr:hypothetical protein AX17_004459 [Amanita inopinata Kibby_2008]
MAPSDDDKDELMLSCRYGDIDDICDFIKKYGQESLASVRDENGNCVLHMVAGNGHIDILDYLLPIVSPSLLSTQNNAGSTPLHWASLNAHLDVVQKLIQFPGGPGANLIDIKNNAGRSSLTEAEMADWLEGANYMVQVMNISAEETENEERGEAVDMDDGGEASNSRHDIEVEIQDADGELAKMRISSHAHTST